MKLLYFWLLVAVLVQSHRGAFAQEKGYSISEELSRQILLTHEFNVSNDGKSSLISWYNEEGRLGVVTVEKGQPKIVLPFLYKFVNYLGNEHLDKPISRYIAYKTNPDSVGVIDISTGAEVVPFEYKFIEYITPFVNKAQKEGKLRLINAEGNLVSDSVFVNVGRSATNGSVFPASIEVDGSEKWAYFDPRGNRVTEFTYELAGEFCAVCWGEDDFPLARVIREGKQGLVNAKGKEVLPIRYDEIWPNGTPLIPLRQGNRWGCVDTTGRLVVPFEFDSIVGQAIGLPGIMGPLYPVKSHDRWAVMNGSGKLITPFLFSDTRTVFREVVLLKKDCKWGGIHRTGAEAIPFVYDEVLDDFNGLAVAVLLREQKRYSVGVNGEIYKVE